MNTLRAATLLSLLLVSACASVGVTPLKTASSKPYDCSLDIYLSEKEVPKSFETLCLLDSRTGTTAFDDRSASAAINLSRPHACQCGADAIVVSQVDTEGMTLSGWGQGKAIIRAIRYTPQK